MNGDNKKEILKKFIDRGYLLAPDILGEPEFNANFLDIVDTRILSNEKPIVLGIDIYKGIANKGVASVNWSEFEKSLVLHEKKRNSRPYKRFQAILCENEDVKKILEEKIPEKEVILLQKDFNKGVNVLKSYDKKPKKWEVKDFTAYFRQRYTFLLQVLQGRPELQDTISINRIKTKQDKEAVSCVGLVYDKRISKSNNIVLSLEDPTGVVQVVIKPTLEGAEDLCLDEVIGIKGTVTRKMIFAEQLFYPDIPTTQNIKRASEDAYLAVISDIHVGSNNFLEENFLKFIDWLNLKNVNPKEKVIAEKIKYLFIVGDLVAGNGVYPHQEQDLVIKDLRSQYQKLAEYLSMVRSDISMIICPGNHDATRLAEPQPPLIKEFAAPLFQLKNATFVSSPAIINIHADKKFEGFNVLMYHGSSFHYYNNSVHHLRVADAKNNPRLTWKYLLKKRHLAPTHGATVYLPDSKEDALLIDKIPDIVLNGDIHRSDLGEYNGIITISPSCWEKKSIIQERRGNEPDPGRVPFFNLRTREVTFLDFYKQK